MSYCSFYALDVLNSHDQSLMHLEEVTRKSETSDVHVAKCADFPRRYLAQNSGEDFSVGVIKARLYCFTFSISIFLGPKFT